MSDQALIIECILKRPGGSIITMKDGTPYHFKDDGLGNHVSAVSAPEHIQRFMQIPEAYRIFGSAAVADPIVITTDAAPADAATDAAPATDPAADAAVDLTGFDQAEVKALTDLTEEELRALFEIECKRKASPKAKIDTMIATIEAIRAERAAAAV